MGKAKVVYSYDKIIGVINAEFDTTFGKGVAQLFKNPNSPGNFLLGIDEKVFNNEQIAQAQAIVTKHMKTNWEVENGGE